MPELPEPLRIVFFGPPASGKTRLLGAVAAVLGKDAEDVPVDFAPADSSIHWAVFPHRVLVDRPGPHTETGAVLLVDCESGAATDLLEHPDELRRETAGNELRNAIRRADAMVVTIDATWDVYELRESLRQFHTFLDTFEEGRTYDRESGGLPVFLVLTKCDALMRPGDSRTQWLSRITHRQNEVLDRFHDLFDEAGPAGDLEFGSLDLKVVPTALDMPGGEAFGIDGLANELLRAARQNADRVTGTQRRLAMTVGGIAGLFIVLMVVFGLLGWIGPPGPLRRLELQIEEYHAHRASAAVRFSDGNFDANRRRVQAFLDSPEFPLLRPELQESVRAVLAEFDRYREYRARFHPPQFSPAELRTAGEMEQLRKDLATSLAPPAEYRDAWQGTQAVQLYEKWTKDLELLGTAEDQFHGWYRELIRRATKLMLVEAPSAAWRQEADSLFREAERRPFELDAAMADSPRVNARRGEPLTYDVAYRFERTESAARDWDLASDKLRRLSVLCEALGLTPESKDGLGAALVIPENAPRSLGTERMAKLVGHHFPTDHVQVSQFPDPIRRELARRLETYHERGMGILRGMIAAELGAESIADWERVSGQFLLRPDVTDWGIFLQTLSILSGRGDGDPVVNLDRLTHRKRFEWPVRSVELYLPNALRENALVPDGAFTITVTPSDGAPRVWLFRDAKAIRSDSQGTTWRFEAAHADTIGYSPGEAFDASVKLRDGETKYSMGWLGGWSKVYRFDRLAAEPTLIRDGPNAIPQKATGVTLRMLPESAAICVPALLPAMPGVK
jgi:hypothetical protein